MERGQDTPRPRLRKGMRVSLVRDARAYQVYRRGKLGLVCVGDLVLLLKDTVALVTGSRRAQARRPWTRTLLLKFPGDYREFLVAERKCERVSAATKRVPIYDDAS